MLLKQVNLIINITSQVLKFFITMYLAIIVAKFIWWVLEPRTPDVYVAPSDVRLLDNGVKFIINRAPFGVVPVAQSYKPAIASLVKLTGVYVAGESSNSLAFYEINNKSYIAKVGDTINGSAILKSVSTNSIMLSENNINGEVPLSVAAPGSAKDSGMNRRIGSRNDNTIFNNRSNSQEGEAGGGVNPQLPNALNDIEQRKKIVEDFVQQSRVKSQGRNTNEYNEQN